MATPSHPDTPTPRHPDTPAPRDPETLCPHGTNTNCPDCHTGIWKPLVEPLSDIEKARGEEAAKWLTEKDMAQRAVVREMYRTIAKRDLMEKKGIFSNPLISKDVEEFHSIRKQAKTQDRPWAWITISPRLDTDPLKIYAIMQKWLEKHSNYEAGCYAIEQTGTTMEEIGHHPHIHILMKMSKPITNQKLQVSLMPTLDKSKGVKIQYFGEVCDPKPSFIKIRRYEEGSKEWTQKNAYIRGNKKPEKMKAVELDRMWRRRLGIPDIIEF